MNENKYKIVIHGEVPDGECVEKYPNNPSLVTVDLGTKYHYYVPDLITMQDIIHRKHSRLVEEKIISKGLQPIVSKSTSYARDNEYGTVKKKFLYCVDKNFILYVVEEYYLNGDGSVLTPFPITGCNSIVTYIGKMYDLPLPNTEITYTYDNGLRNKIMSRIGYFREFIEIDKFIQSQKPGTDLGKIFSSQHFKDWWLKMYNLFNDNQDIYNILNGKTTCIRHNDKFILEVTTISATFSYQELVDIVRNNQKMVNAFGYTKLMDTKQFKSADIPINFFKLSSIVITRSRCVKYTFDVEIKEDV